MLAALLFDFDGTIAETERLGHRVAYNAAFAQLGLPWIWDEALYGELLAIGGGKERIAAYIERARPAGVPAADRAAFIAAIHETKQAIFTPLAARIQLRPGIKRIIREARANDIRVAIATTAARAGVDAVIGHDPELRDAFAFIAAGDIVPHKKPAPDIYTYVVDRLGVATRDCLAIEDSAIGTRAALAAGIVTLVTVSDYTRDEDFTGAATVVTDLGEPDAHARVLSGSPLPAGLVDLAYLRTLVDAPQRPPIG